MIHWFRPRVCLIVMRRVHARCTFSRGSFRAGLLILTGIQLLTACAGAPKAVAPPPRELPRPVVERDAAAGGDVSGSIAEIQRLTEAGVPGAMLQALDLIRGRNLGSSEFGRVMNSVNAAIFKRVYPDMAEGAALPAPDLPQSHIYARILREVERGAYTVPPEASGDFLEHTLPFLALVGETRPERLLAALPDLEKARTLRPDSALAPYFSGLVFERTGRFAEAETAYARAAALSPDCYPAVLGLCRMMSRLGKKREALRRLEDLAGRYPGNLEIKRQFAAAYYEYEDWGRAEAVVAELLERGGQHGDDMLMWAHILVEQGRFAQAQAPLDRYAGINPQNPLYLLLRARLQAEGYRNREAALGLLRSILRVSPGDEEAQVYAARLLMESPQAAERAEGRELMGRLLRAANPSPAVLSLGLQDALGRENWQEARGFAEKLLSSRRSRQDLLDAAAVEAGLGNTAAALSYATELYERDPAFEEGAAAYVSALIGAGRRDEAGRMIERRLSALEGGPLKSRYYYLQSRLRSGEEAALGDLRSSLFEDPRNLDALIAMVEIYRRRKDDGRARYYLKQAQAIAPGNPRLSRYERD